MSISKFARLAFVVVLIAMVMQLGQTQTAQAATNSQVVSKQVRPAQQAAAVKFWTHEALANAQPFPMMVDASADVPASVEDSAVGSAGSSSAGMAAVGADSVAQKGYPADWAVQGEDSFSLTDEEAVGGSQIYTSYYANYYTFNWKIYPHVWVGRLSFSTTGGTSYCSGTSISGNVMVTAAHCLYDTTNNVWYSNWVFSPAYRNGTAPYGTFPASTCWVLSNWVNLTGGFSINGWTKYDVGVCKMGNNSLGQSLNAAVGWAGRQWNYGYDRSFHNMGYPWQDSNLAALPNAGKFLRLCTAESFTQTTDTMGMGCNFGPGISGGPWMISYAPGFAQGYVNSVNSGLYVGVKNLYGLRFTSSNIVPLCNAAVC